MHDTLRRRVYVLVIALCASLAAAPALALRGSLPDFAGLVKQASPAVVNISTSQKLSVGNGGLPGLKLPDLPPDHPLREFLERFGGGEELPPDLFDARSLGSGFIISPDGYILTNNHVVKDADEVVVRLSDRREFVAKVVGQDERSDLALLKIDATDLPVVRIGKSADLEVGEWVLAIGSPFGFEHSATAGIVSAKGRSLPHENYVPFIQTDVAINPGNSGGPLFNLDGDVVGINSQIYSRTGGFMGLSFAIPIELAMDVAEQLRNKGKVSRGWLGVLIQDVTRELAESFGMKKPYGALVAQVMAGSPADEGGLKVGDVIVEFGDKEITTSASLPPLVGRTGVGETVSVKVIRDGRSRVLKVTVGELPEDAGSPATPATPATPERGYNSPELALTVEEPTAEQREALGVESGVLVTSVAAGPAQDAGIASGDVIAMLNQRKIGGLTDFRKAVQGLPADRSVPVLVIREGNPRFLALKAAKRP